MPEATAVTAVPTPSVDDYTYQGAPLATWIAANVTTPGPHLLILTVAGELEYLTVTV